MSSTSPTTASTGQSMSDSVTRSPWMEKPPVIIRLWAMNCLSSSEMAGPGPGDPTLGGQESALLFARQQRLAVVQLPQEFQPRLRGLDRVEHLEAGTRQPPWNVDPGEDVIGHEVGGGGREARRQIHRQSGQRVDRCTERHDAGEVLGPAIGRGLIGEHPTLRIARQVDVAARDLFDGVDGLAQRDDMVGEVAVHAALDLVGRPEVDDPRVDSRGVQDPTAPASRVTSHMSADIIIGCTISTGGPGRLAPAGSPTLCARPGTPSSIRSAHFLVPLCASCARLTVASRCARVTSRWPR